MTSPRPLPPVVLLHAFPMHAALFSAVRLPPPWRLITPDRRGFGSQASGAVDARRVPPSMDVLVDDLVGRLDAMGEHRVILGGVSMGGYVTLACAARYPERIAGLILADTRATADDQAERQRRLAIAERADRGDIPSGHEAVDALIAPGTGPQVRAALAAMAAQAPATSIGWAQRAMAGRADTTAALAMITVPSLMIVGERDQVTPVAAARAMADVARDATLEIIPGAGHLTPAEAPSAFNDALVRWLRRGPW